MSFLSRKKIHVPAKFYQTRIALVCGLLSGAPARGADVLPSAIGVRGRPNLQAGELSAGLSVDGSRKTLAGFTERGRIESSAAHQGHMVLGLGITRQLDLSLGVKGTYERLSPKAERSLFDREIDDEIERGGESRATTGAVSGATAALKLKLMDAPLFRLSAIGFGEGGAGGPGRLSVTRSQRPKGGWLALISYGEAGFAEMSLSGGMRYRDPETIGDLRLRHELLYGGLLRFWATRKFDVFGSYDGRRLMVAKRQDGQLAGETASWSDYRAVDNGVVSGGVGLQMGSTYLSIYGGRSVKSDVIGASKAVAGLSLTYSFGKIWNEDAAGKVLAESEAKPARPQEPEKIDSALKTTGNDEIYLDPDGKPLDVLKTDAELKATDGPDDFDLFRAEALKRKDSQVNEDQKAEEELARLREAEAKVEEEKARREVERARIQRESDRRAATERARRADQLRREVKGDVDRVDGIGEEDVSWQGLD